MTLLSNGNVKISHDRNGPEEQSDGLMTLVRAKDASKMPVYFCTLPFLLENETVREIIANSATLQPQPVSIFISEQTHELQPDLMLSVQAYCVNNEDVIQLETIDIVNRDQQFEATEITLLFGSEELLQLGLNNLADNADSTVIYFPENIQDQLKLHSLLNTKKEHAVIPVINTSTPSFNKNQPDGTAFIQAVDLAIAQDLQLFHWIEGNASQLYLQQPDTVSQLVASFNMSASTKSPTLIEDSADLVNLLSDKANGKINSADAAAILILIKTQLSVLAELLPSGADARVWHLLSTLGHTLYFSGLTQHTAAVSKHLSEQSSPTLLADIGEMTATDEIQSSAVEAAMLWIESQNG